MVIILITKGMPMLEISSVQWFVWGLYIFWIWYKCYMIMNNNVSIMCHFLRIVIMWVWNMLCYQNVYIFKVYPHYTNTADLVQVRVVWMLMRLVRYLLMIVFPCCLRLVCLYIIHIVFYRLLHVFYRSIQGHLSTTDRYLDRWKWG